MRLTWLSLCCAAALVGCTDASSSPASEREAEVERLVSEMTLEEKIAQMAGSTPIAGPYGANLWMVPGVERLGVPPFAMSDGPRGVGVGEGRTVFPVAMARAATWNPDIEERVGEAIGRELRAIGGNVLLAPAINNLRHPSWGRSQETYGEDVHLLSRMGVAAVRGIQKYVLANPKHYTANSIEDTRFQVNVTIDERTLREIYLAHFRAAIEEGEAASIMSAYNSVNGQFCGENVTLLRRILKEEWGFDGFVLSDFTFGTHEDSAVNGLDLEMPVANVFESLPSQVASGEVPEEVIDDAVRRMVRKKLQYALGEPSPVDESVIESDAHLAIAQEAATEGAVLLKNDGATLPIDPASTPSLVVVGTLANLPNTGDTGSSSVEPSFVVTPLEGLQAAVGDSVEVQHVDKDVLAPTDLDLLASADAVVVVTGLSSEDEGEGLIGAGDRVDLSLGPVREQLILDAAAANPRTIVVLEGGGAITVGNWLPEVEALLMVWYPGQMGGHAIAELLLGEANPSGKLPLTFPKGLDQLPPFDNVSLEVTYDYFHGYRFVDRNGYTPEFPFGYGGSYTTFRIENLRADRVEAGPNEVVTFRVDVTNTGEVAGAEVVQVYFTYPGSSVERAERELKGFAKVELEPSETRTVEIGVSTNRLAYYDVSEASWVLETLEHVVLAGTSSRDLPLSTTLTIRSGGPIRPY